MTSSTIPPLPAGRGGRGVRTPTKNSAQHKSPDIPDTANRRFPEKRVPRQRRSARIDTPALAASYGRSHAASSAL
jgi:hypothetical protein